MNFQILVYPGEAKMRLGCMHLRTPHAALKHMLTIKNRKKVNVSVCRGHRFGH